MLFPCSYNVYVFEFDSNIIQALWKFITEYENYAPRAVQLKWKEL